MPDVFEILIKFGLSKEKATEAARELDKLKDATTATGKEGVKQEEAVTEATNKTFASKKQLKDMIKQVAHEFPVVGAAGRLMMNPIVAATTAATVAMANLQSKTAEAARSMGGFELPSISEDAVARFERMTAAAQKFAQSAPDIKSAASDLAKLIDLQNSFAKGAGMDLGTKPDEIKAQAFREVSDRLAQRAAESAAAAGNLNPDNNVIAAANPKLLAQLEKERERLQGRLDFLDEPGGTWSAKGLRYLWRYGAVSPSAAREVEQSGLDSVNTQIKNLTDMGTNRGRRLGLRDLAARDAEDAQAAYGQAATFGGAAAQGAGGEFKQAAAGLTADLAGLVPSIIKTADAFQKGQQLMERALSDQEKANAALLRKLNNQNQRP